MMTDSSEQECYEEEMQVETKNKWEKGMNEQMDSLVRNQTWDLVELHACKKELQNEWVYRLKEGGGKKW